MTERVCEFKWPRSSSLGQCTSVFSSFDELYYSHFHKLTHIFTTSGDTSILSMWKVYWYYCQANLSSFTFMHLLILLSKRYTWELNPWLWHCWCWYHESKYISTHSNTEKAIFSAYADFIMSIDLEAIQSDCSRS